MFSGFVSISSLTGECAAQKLKNLCSSSLWTCLHHMVILRSQNKITDFWMILAWASPFKYTSSRRPRVKSNRHLDVQLIKVRPSHGCLIFRGQHQNMMTLVRWF